LEAVPRDGFIRRQPSSLSNKRYGKPGHLTIHTWPELGKYAMDIVEQDGNVNLVKRIQIEFPGDYQIITEFRGVVNPVTEAPQKIGREVVAYFGEVGNSRMFRERNIDDVLYDIACEAKFKVVGQARRENERYLSGIVLLSTSHMCMEYDKEKNCAAVDIFTCVEDEKDEGDPVKGMELAKVFLSPISHKDDYVLHRPIPR
jgi:S-adenosylmethionine/arginine decarboxylase-like enzyme